MLFGVSTCNPEVLLRVPLLGCYLQMSLALYTHPMDIARGISRCKRDDDRVTQKTPKGSYSPLFPEQSSSHSGMVA